MNFWFVLYPLFHRRRCSEIDDTNKKIKELEEKNKKLDSQNKKLESIERIINGTAEVVRCFHSYNENLTGYHELQRYGCRCKRVELE
jgi:DNA-binding transcriptional regulator GbsR (MarR family)